MFLVCQFIKFNYFNFCHTSLLQRYLKDERFEWLDYTCIWPINNQLHNEVEIAIANPLEFGVAFFFYNLVFSATDLATRRSCSYRVTITSCYSFQQKTIFVSIVSSNTPLHPIPANHKSQPQKPIPTGEEVSQTILVSPSISSNT